MDADSDPRTLSGFICLLAAEVARLEVASPDHPDLAEMRRDLADLRWADRLARRSSQ